MKHLQPVWHQQPGITAFKVTVSSPFHSDAHVEISELSNSCPPPWMHWVAATQLADYTFLLTSNWALLVNRKWLDINRWITSRTLLTSVVISSQISCFQDSLIPLPTLPSALIIFRFSSDSQEFCFFPVLRVSASLSLVMGQVNPWMKTGIWKMFVERCHLYEHFMNRNQVTPAGVVCCMLLA